MDIISDEEILRAEEVLDDLSGLGYSPWQERWIARRKRRAAARARGVRRPAATRQERSKEEKKRLLNQLAAQYRATTKTLRAQAADALAQIKNFQGIARNRTNRAVKYEQMARDKQRRADAIVVSKAITV